MCLRSTFIYGNTCKHEESIDANGRVDVCCASVNREPRASVGLAVVILVKVMDGVVRTGSQEGPGRAGRLGPSMCGAL